MASAGQSRSTLACIRDEGGFFPLDIRICFVQVLRMTAFGRGMELPPMTQMTVFPMCKKVFSASSESGRGCALSKSKRMRRVPPPVVRVQT